MKLLAVLATLFVLISIVRASEQPECATTSYANYPLCYTWRFNSMNTSAYFDGALTDVQNATVVTISGKSYMQISATGIPQYNHQMTADEVAWLNARPKASVDFTSGRTTAVAGQTVVFGESIGYSSTHCTLGYWPPGPSCPTVASKSGKFPLAPTKSTQTCYTGLGAMGYWINGVSIYNWWDGTSYNSQNVWHTMASYAEEYDMDICWGHAANGDYHHHFYPNCLAESLDDDGSRKSPIYGFAADGYPILGPYISAGVLAKSCWKARDYSASSPTGCGQNNKRTCLLVNNLNITLGTTATTSAGPDTTATVVTQSGNELTAVSGFYYEDYYYDSSCTAQGDEYLDQYNGRYDSTYGYVYHVVIENNGGVYPSSPFPHYVGPVYYGQLDSNTIATCQTNPFSSGGGGEQPPPPDNGCCPDGSIPSSGNPPCKGGPPSPVYCNTAHRH